jgi:AraC-like DNA-binding protein
VLELDRIGQVDRHLPRPGQRPRRDLASARLRDTDDTVGAIARSLGYTSEYAFNRAFTRHRRIPPGRYRTRSRASFIRQG